MNHRVSMFLVNKSLPGNVASTKIPVSKHEVSLVKRDGMLKRYATGTNDDSVKRRSDRNNEKNWVCGSVSLEMPFSSEVAFDTFSNLPRQPEWSPWLSSVEYLSEVGKTADGMALYETQWYLRGKGVKLSWKAVSTILDRPNRIRWKSTSGVRNEGTVDFESVGSNCIMTLQMRFVAPRFLYSIFGSAGVRNFFEKRLLGGTLSRFREVVLNDLSR